MRTRRTAAAAALAAVALVVTACGTSADADSGEAVGSGSGTTADTDAGANDLTVTTDGMAYVISGAPRPGHVDITFDNPDEVAHEMSVMRLADGKTVDDLLADLEAGGEEAAAADLAGDPGATSYGTPALLYGGQSTEVLSDVMEAGDYAVLCFLPGPGGVPHVAMGMAAQFTVAGDEVDGTPTSDGAVELTDDGITVPDGFGSGTYAVTNSGTIPHSFSVASLESSLDDLFTYIGGQFAQNQPIDGGPGALVAGVSTLQPGQTAHLVVDLPAGRYGYVSTEQGQDPADTDYARGLHGEFTVG